MNGTGERTGTGVTLKNYRPRLVYGPVFITPRQALYHRKLIKCVLYFIISMIVNIESQTPLIN